MTSKIAGGALIVLLIAAQILFVAAYIDAEHTIYFWDHAMYLAMARQAYEAFGQNFSDGWANFRQSFAGNYNLIYALPSFLSFGLFGPSRLVFILTNYLVFFLAYEMAVACFLRAMLKCRWQSAFLLSFVSAALIPPLWLPLLEGYPDSGAAACLVFAAALFFGLPQRLPWFLCALRIGIILGFAVLLRRHFAYPAIAMLIALGCFSLWDIRGKKNFKKGLAGIISYFAVCGVGCIGIIYLIAPDFVVNALTINYGALYFSYKRAPSVFLHFLLREFGYSLLLIAAGGLVLLARMNEQGKRLALFVTLFVFLWLVIWCLGPDQMGHHYALHALPLWVSAGFAGWFFYLAKQPRRKKRLIGSALGVALAANSAWALWFSPTGVWPNDNGTPGLFSAPRPPVVRSDYDEWLRLAAYLRQNTGPQDRIMMVGSSFVFNQDLMRSVYADILNRPDLFSRFVRSGEIDHEEPAPFNPFAAANIYLVPEPAQYHLDPVGQRVITAAANQFPPPLSRIAMFHEDDAVFHLADGVIVHVWRRDEWKPAALHEALAQIRKDGPQDANFAQDWATTLLPLQAQIFTNGQNHTFVAGFFDSAHKDMQIFFDYPLAPGAQRVVLAVAANCPALQLSLTVLAGDGRKETTKNFTPEPGSAAFSQTFTVPVLPDDPRFLELGLTTAPAALCRVDLRDLRVEIQP